MKRYELTEPAASDLESIADYVGGPNPTAALRLLDRLTEVFQKLAQMPGMGRQRVELAPGLRSFPVGSYVVFYREIPDGAQIVRVLHGARDLSTVRFKE